MESTTEVSARRGRARFVFDLITTVAMLAAAGFVIWSNWPKARPRKNITLPHDPVSLDGAATSGSATAPVVLLTYTDFQCPYCGRFARDTMPRIRKQYVDTGRIQIAIRNLPLPIHPLAPGAAVTAACAGRQGRFWQMHDLLFQDQKHLEAADLASRASQLGLDMTAFDHCRDDPTATAEIETDRRGAEVMRITSTPTSLIGIRQADGRARVVQVLPGAVPYESMSKELDLALQQPTATDAVVTAAAGPVAGGLAIVAAMWLYYRHRRRSQRVAQR